jgi:hypothetical protein
MVVTVATMGTFNRIGKALANRLKPCELVEREELFFAGVATPDRYFLKYFSLCLLHFVEFGWNAFYPMFSLIKSMFPSNS